MEITLEVLERKLKNLMDSAYLPWRTLTNDAELIRLIVNGASNYETMEHLRDTYPDYFDEGEE